MDLVREHTRTHNLEMNLHVYLKKEKLKVNIFMHTQTWKRMDGKKLAKTKITPICTYLCMGDGVGGMRGVLSLTIYNTYTRLKILNLDGEKKFKEYEHFYSRLMRKVRERARKQHAAILHSALAAIRLFGHLNPHTPSSNYCMYIYNDENTVYKHTYLYGCVFIRLREYFKLHLF